LSEPAGNTVGQEALELVTAADVARVKHWRSAPIIAVMVLALLLRLGGVGFGLPYVYHPDEHFLVDPALAILASHDLNPHWFNYPDLYIYAQTVVLAVARAVLESFGGAPGALQVQGLMYLAGRLATVLTGTAAVYVTYRAGRRLWGELAGISAALVLAVAFAHVQNSQFITVDVPCGFLSAACIWGAVHGYRGGGNRWFVVSGVLAGLAAATKYNAVVALAAPLALWLAGCHGRRECLSWVPVLTVVAAILAFVVVMPWVLLDPVNVWKGVFFEIQHYRTGHEGAEGSDSWLFYLKYLWQLGLTPPLCLLALAGWLASAAKDWRRWLGLSAFPLLFYGMMAAQRVRFERNLMPIMAPVALFGGYGLALALGWYRARTTWTWPVRAAGMLVLAAGIGWPILQAAVYDYQVSAPDTRTVAAAWMETNLPAGATICQEQYGPPLDGSQRFRVTTVWGLYERSLQSYRQDCDYVVASSKLYARYTNNAVAYPQKAAFYAELFSQLPLVREFRGHESTVHDPVIRIYRTR